MLATKESRESTLLMEEAHGTLEYLPELKALVYQPVGDITEEVFMADYQKLLKAAVANKPKRILFNETGLKSIPTGARIWFSLKFMRIPAAQAMFARRPEVIVIKAKSIFASSITGLLHQVITRATGIKVKYYQTEEEALAYAERASRFAA